MTLIFLIKWLHVIGAAVLLGTGSGIAFFMLMAHLTGNIGLIAGVVRIVVIADFLFTATAVVAQPITGVALTYIGGYSLGEGWIVLSILLYVFTGVFWLPVVWMQWRIGELAGRAMRDGTPLPPRYYRLFKTWFAFGFPAFAAVLSIFWLMIARPAIPLLTF